MAFARLAPHCGLTPVYGIRVGNSDMRGGFSWSSLGNSLSSGLNKIGNFVTNTAKQIGSSQAFQQAKTGFLRSGILENAGQLAGQAVSSLVDIGRLKLENDIQKLRDKVLSEQQGQAPPLTQEQLMQLLAAANSSKSPITVTPAPQPEPIPNEPSPDIPVALGPYIPPDQPPSIPEPSRKRLRKRKRVTGWGAALNGMLGDGVNFEKKRYCY
ncbi:pVI protein [Barthadenovirus sternae]|nr:pVI [Tern adenovirus]UJZ92511.1 pVI protein [Tern atadenovirus 1]